MTDGLLNFGFKYAIMPCRLFFNIFATGSQTEKPI